MNIIYAGSYKHDEQKTLESMGARCFRISDPFKTNFVADSLPKQCVGVALFRSPKIAPAQYEKLYTSLAESGIDLLVTPSSFSEFHKLPARYRALAGFGPKEVYANASDSIESILKSLEATEIETPIFVRTDVESAAKYSGVESCFIRNLDEQSLIEAMKPIKSHIKAYSTIIFKENIEIAVDPASGGNVEFRAICLGGDLAFFDYDERKVSVHPQDIDGHRFITKVLSKLKTANIVASAFIDIALVAGGGVVIVEMKDLHNGTIVNLDALGRFVMNAP